MKRKSYIFILAFLGILSAVWAIKNGLTPQPEAAPIISPVEKPYSQTIAASGIIEALGNNLSIGSPADGIVQEIYVEVWQIVKKGDPLFKLDSLELEAELKVAEAKEKVAAATYQRVHDQLMRLSSVKDMRAISQEELRSKENESQVVLAQLEQARSEKEKIEVLLKRLTVKAPSDGMVLQKNIRVGEYIASSNTEHPPVVIGNTLQLQIRTDIDEHNALHISKIAEAVAYPKNRPDCAIPLAFVRIEPYIIPKVSLTGSSREKVDTRVLQIIYSFEPAEDISLYIGQQVDVYIKRDEEKA